MSDEKLFKEVEHALNRALTDEERRFLILAHRIFENNRLSESEKPKAKGAPAA